MKEPANATDKCQVMAWLLEGDVSIQYQVHRDLLATERPSLRERIATEGWGAKFLSFRQREGHWGRGFYQPKWTSTHYTILDLKNLAISPDNTEIRQSISQVVQTLKGPDGGIFPFGAHRKSDVCVNGMFLNYASYFGTAEDDLRSIVDFLLAEHMVDGGFNCHSNWRGAVHSSMHSTISVLEGILEYAKSGHQYRLDELESTAEQARAFLLQHRLFRSDRTGEVIDRKMRMLSYPSRWRYDILRALDYFQLAQVDYDPRMQDALDVLVKKRRKDHKWPVQARHPGQIHFEMEKTGGPSRWNTLRAMRVLQHFSETTRVPKKMPAASDSVPMQFKANLTDSLTRWRAFWRHDVADRPPMVVRFQREPSSRLEDLRMPDLEDSDRQFDLDYVSERVRRAEAQFAQRASFPDDTLPQVAAPNGLAVVGWALGAQVKTAAGIPWVWPFLDTIDEWHGIDFDAVVRRFDRILEIDRSLASLSRGRYAVSSTSLDGPADMVVRMLGEEKLALALYDRPDEVERLFSRCTDVWQEVVRRKLQVIPTYGGGTATGWDYWVPGKGIALQEDFGQMISPKQFRDMILKHDVRLVNGLDCVWFHVHSGALHMAREIAASGAFHGIQITNDYPAGPAIEEILPTMQAIQQRTCLILRKFSLDQLDRVIRHLSPKGLAIDIQCYDATATDDIQMTLMTRQEALQVIRWAEDWMEQVSTPT